jgi:pyruvyl transferase EpsI
MTIGKYYKERRYLKMFINKKHMIILHGGGNMGTAWFRHEELRRDVIMAFPKNRIIIMPQSIDFSDGQDWLRSSGDIYALHSDLHIIVRDGRSFEIAKEAFSSNNTYLIPDTVFSLDGAELVPEEYDRKGAILCMRNDVEKSNLWVDEDFIFSLLKDLCGEVTRVDTILPGRAAIPIRRQAGKLASFVSKIKQARLVVTDRMHMMIFCVITGTPCIVFPNSYHKIKGTYEWIKKLPYIYYTEDVIGIEEVAKDLLKLKPQVYDSSMFIDKYDEILELIIKQK